ncbi:methyltransferase [Actinacidiphila paucisporea]|uniref:Hydroxyneurosporene-O-methyltransferase n=1 Tax=Actinacidiphila paucisporea TaxID=310782 RepID=A0A1M7NNM5_9ACTN|nr:methyltransferase [Actinacidiphila paucisporea]SHN05374.1 hydroxyneurosporene-O-methyltransferase [Actinacidiphila paucisporea]
MSNSQKMPPPRLVRIVERLRERVYRLHQRMMPASVTMLEMITAGMVSQAIQVAATLGIADVLAGGPRTAEEIAQQVGADPDGVNRLLRALAGYGVFRADPSGRYALTPLAGTLRSDAEMPMRSIAMFTNAPEQREHWSYLLDSVRTGEPVMEKVRGVDVWTYFENNEELVGVFNDAMTDFSNLTLAPVTAAYDFRRFGTIVDVGGGQGAMLAAILARTPRARGVVFDLSTAAAGAEDLLRGAGLAGRCTVESGSFLETVPSGGDCYLLKNVIHNWPDDEVVVILRNVRRAIAPAGRLLVIELIIPEGNGTHPGKLSDLDMMLLVGGRERTEADTRALLAKAGFRLDRVIQTASPLSILEASPV